MNQEVEAHVEDLRNTEFMDVFQDIFFKRVNSPKNISLKIFKIFLC
jgi:hypothetical protein